jgi:DNA-binding CsgD family transcriptional regulator/tetratricopeptide (TPR) repeat protein
MSFAVIPPSTEGSSRPLLGREEELRWVTAGLRAAQRGARALIAVEGAPGIGKSCLLREAQRRAEEMDMLVVAMRDPSRAPDELIRVAGGLAAERPVLIAVDDVDRCDRESLRALVALALRLDDLHGVALLVARRYDAPWCVDSGALDALAGDPAAIRIRLGPLGVGDAAAIVEAGVGTSPEPGFAASVHRFTGGNPFLVAELTLHLGEHGIAPVDAHAEELSELALAGVARAVRALAADVDDDPEPLLGALAVLGDDAELSATAAVLGLSYLHAADRCGRLVTAGVLTAHDPPRFAQPLLRPAIYGTMGPARRSRLHDDAARALAAVGAPVETIATHIVAGAPASDPWAAVMLRSAARSARARGGMVDACAYLRRALAEDVDEVTSELELELGLAEAALGLVSAASHIQRAYNLAGSGHARARIGLTLARLTAATRARSSAGDWCLISLVQVRDSDDPELVTRLHAELIAASTSDCEAASAAALVPSECPQVDDPAGHLLLSLQADHAARAGRTRACAVGLARRALSSRGVWREHGSLIPHMAVEVLVAAEHLEEAKAAWDAGLTVAEEHGLIWDAAVIRAHRAGALLRLGEVGAAVEDARTALERVGHTTGPVRKRAAANLAEALVELGSLGAAAAALDGVRDDSEASDPRSALASARIWIAHGRHADALAELETAARAGIANPALVPWRSLAAECHVALGDRDAAWKLATEELGLARAFGAPAAQARALRALARTTDGVAALGPLEEAVRLLEGSPAQLECARALLDLGVALSATDEAGAARDGLRRAMAIAHRCGASMLATRARDALIAAGGRPRRPIHEGLESLTRSERSVAELAAAGRTNREIGSELYVTLNTVSTHLRSVYRKLNIKSRAQLPGHFGSS